MFRILMLAATALLFACAPEQSQGQTPQKGYVVGKVVDQNGKPVRDAEIFVGYQSLGGGTEGYGASHHRTGKTGPDGTYRVQIGNMAMGEYSVSGKAYLMQGRQRVEMNLVPDNPKNFANNAATVRNFRLKFAETTADSSYGEGGMVLVSNAIGDYDTSLADVEITLRPVGGGAAIARPLRSTGEGYVATGLPFGTYEITATHKGRPLLIGTDDEMGRSYTSEFKRYGPGIYQIRVVVKGR